MISLLWFNRKLTPNKSKHVTIAGGGGGGDEVGAGEGALSVATQVTAPIDQCYCNKLAAVAAVQTGGRW